MRHLTIFLALGALLLVGCGTERQLLEDRGAIIEESRDVVIRSRMPEPPPPSLVGNLLSGRMGSIPGEVQQAVLSAGLPAPSGSLLDSWIRRDSKLGVIWYNATQGIAECHGELDASQLYSLGNWKALWHKGFRSDITVTDNNGDVWVAYPLGYWAYRGWVADEGVPFFFQVAQRSNGPTSDQGYNWGKHGGPCDERAGNGQRWAQYAPGMTEIGMPTGEAGAGVLDIVLAMVGYEAARWGYIPVFYTIELMGR